MMINLKKLIQKSSLLMFLLIMFFGKVGAVKVEVRNFTNEGGNLNFKLFLIKDQDCENSCNETVAFCMSQFLNREAKAKDGDLTVFSVGNELGKTLLNKALVRLPSFELIDFLLSEKYPVLSDLFKLHLLDMDVKHKKLKDWKIKVLDSNIRLSWVTGHSYYGSKPYDFEDYKEYPFSDVSLSSFKSEVDDFFKGLTSKEKERTFRFINLVLNDFKVQTENFFEGMRSEENGKGALSCCIDIFKSKGARLFDPDNHMMSILGKLMAKIKGAWIVAAITDAFLMKNNLIYISNSKMENFENINNIISLLGFKQNGENKEIDLDDYGKKKKIEKSCFVCGERSMKGIKSLYYCGGCKEILYCSVDCQKKDRPKHKKECRKK